MVLRIGVIGTGAIDATTFAWSIRFLLAQELSH